jgi:amphi-Trp domain-containing protein
MSTRQAAESLTDIAYALASGGPLQLTLDDQRLSVPLSDELRMRRDLTSSGDRVHLQLRLTWSTAQPNPQGSLR